jgi:drug/metabolite transporter (DMT)-like permease
MKRATAALFRAPSADVLLLCAVSIWALNYSVVKIGLTEIDPLAFPVVRFGVGGLILLGVLKWLEGSIGFRRADVRLLLVASVLGITLSQISFVLALTNTSASDTALLAATSPILTTLLATAVGLERMNRRHWVAAVVGLAGAVLIVAGGASTHHLGQSLLGDLLALGNVIGSSASALPIMPLLRRYSPLRILTWQMLLGTTMLVPFALPSLLTQDYAAITNTGWACLGYAVIFSGIATNLLYFTAIGRVGASRAAMYQYIQSFLAVAFAVVLLSEPVRILQLLGGVVVVGSVVLSRQRPLRGRSPDGRIARQRPVEVVLRRVHRLATDHGAFDDDPAVGRSLKDREVGPHAGAYGSSATGPVDGEEPRGIRGDEADRVGNRESGELDGVAKTLHKRR